MWKVCVCVCVCVCVRARARICDDVAIAQLDPQDHDVRVFYWTGRNAFFMLSNSEYLAMGGG